MTATKYKIAIGEQGNKGIRFYSSTVLVAVHLPVEDMLTYMPRKHMPTSYPLDP